MNFSRREFLKTGLAGSLAVGAGGVLSACGTGNTIKPFTVSNVGKPQTGGQLRAGRAGEHRRDGRTRGIRDALNVILDTLCWPSLRSA